MMWTVLVLVMRVLTYGMLAAFVVFRHRFVDPWWAFLLVSYGFMFFSQFFGAMIVSCSQERKKVELQKALIARAIGARSN